MKVYIVGIRNSLDTNIKYVCLSEVSALKRWNELREEIITDIKKDMDRLRGNDQQGFFTDMYVRILEAMKETDPKKMDSFPQDEPFIQEMETEP